MKRKCVTCGAPARGEHCFRHKPRKALKRSPVRKKARAPKQKGERKKSVKNLKSILWSIYSKYRRLKASDARGFCKCFTCSNIEYWKFMDAGHYVPRKHTMTFIHDKNVHEQCKTCNQIKNGNLDEYTKRLDEVYGEGTAEELKQLARLTKRFNPEELEELINFYTAEFNKLLKIKGLS